MNGLHGSNRIHGGSCLFNVRVFPNTSGETIHAENQSRSGSGSNYPGEVPPPPVRRPPRAQCRFSLLEFSTCNGYSKFIWRIIQRQHWRLSGPGSRPGIPPPWGVTLSRDRHVTLRSGSSISIVGIPMVPTVAANGRNVGIRRLNLVGRDRPGTPGRACHGLVGFLPVGACECPS